MEIISGKKRRFDVETVPIPQPLFCRGSIRYWNWGLTMMVFTVETIKTPWDELVVWVNQTDLTSETNTGYFKVKTTQSLQTPNSSVCSQKSRISKPKSRGIIIFSNTRRPCMKTFAVLFFYCVKVGKAEKVKLELWLGRSKNVNAAWNISNLTLLLREWWE